MIPKEATPEVPIPVIYVTHLGSTASRRRGWRASAPGCRSKPNWAPLPACARCARQAKRRPCLRDARIRTRFRCRSRARLRAHAVDQARPDLPADAREPSVNEVNTALFPVLTRDRLPAMPPERSLNRVAGDLRDTIEGVEGGARSRYRRTARRTRRGAESIPPSSRPTRSRSRN